MRDRPAPAKPATAASASNASLSLDELRAESRAKIFNAYYGSAAGFLAPLLVVAISVGVGLYQAHQEHNNRELERVLNRAREEASTRRECLGQMRETAKMLTDKAGAQQLAYDAMTISVAATLNRVCRPVGVELPSVLVTAAQDVSKNPNASVEEKVAAQQVIRGVLRVFFQISKESQRSAARDLEFQLEKLTVDGSPIQVPGIEKVSTMPRISELRYANADDRVLAEDLAKAISRLLGGATIKPQKISATNVSANTFELWLAP